MLRVLGWTPLIQEWNRRPKSIDLTFSILRQSWISPLILIVEVTLSISLRNLWNRSASLQPSGQRQRKSTKNLSFRNMLKKDNIKTKWSVLVVKLPRSRRKKERGHDDQIVQYRYYMLKVAKNVEVEKGKKR